MPVSWIDVEILVRKLARAPRRTARHYNLHRGTDWDGNIFSPMRYRLTAINTDPPVIILHVLHRDEREGRPRYRLRALSCAVGSGRTVIHKLYAGRREVWFDNPDEAEGMANYPDRAQIEVYAGAPIIL